MMFITQCVDKEGRELLGSCNCYIDRDCKTIKTVHKRFFDYRILHCSDSTAKIIIYSVGELDIYNKSKYKVVDNFLVNKSKAVQK